MAQRVIRINELANTPAKMATPAEPATATKAAKKAKPAVLAKQGKLKVSRATVWRWVREGRLPAPFKLGKNVTVWDEDLIDQFLVAQAVEGV